MREHLLRRKHLLRRSHELSGLKLSSTLQCPNAFHSQGGITKSLVLTIYAIFLVNNFLANTKYFGATTGEPNPVHLNI